MNFTADTQFNEAQKQLLAMHGNVASHEILTLILRLRQLCCHPSLIHSFLDREDLESSGFDEELTAKMKNIDLKSEGGMDESFGVSDKVVNNLLTKDNPVFDVLRESSKV